MSEKNELLGFFLGILLLLGMHIVAIAVIFLLVLIVDKIYGNYSLNVLLYGILGFLFWQLLYVIPVCLWLKRRQAPGMMKGVIIGAVITALLNGTCSLLMFPR
ncbi:hypothetical protein [Cylindrospermum sp. FACHB-282]|uniref:hypothetical protein n=1 Tax=Cylindrospermum sp. FACHB-282 TaxID=2692794 RepID=UPI0016823162|nr:hypothetical protein [Cylindrospermum sp. FACHB-282]MBD2388787.1 hypothetical protein [Cylindrospermum sp. FACHB-282]